MIFNTEGLSNLDPYTTEIEIYADGNLIYKGPTTEITYWSSGVRLNIPTPEYIEKITRWGSGGNL